MNTESKAIAACQSYVRAMTEIRVMTGMIAAALNDCGGATPDTSGDDEYKPTHLKNYYKRGDLAGELGFMGYNGPDYKEEFEACPHCVLADKLVQERKSARQRLGAAKRAISKIGMTP